MERLTLADVLCRAVDELVAAFAANDDAKIANVQAVLNFVYDANTEYSGTPGVDFSEERYRDAELAMILDDLLDSIRDFSYGVPAKSSIPIHERIRSRVG